MADKDTKCRGCGDPIVNETLRYNTRDGQGNDIVVDVTIKKYHEHQVSFSCPICRTVNQRGCQVNDIVSSNFTDWAYVGEYVCPKCTDLFSLYFYSYIVNENGIQILNAREIRDQLCVLQKPPFLFCITTSRKKHLFYRAKWNKQSEVFAVNLETETIYTTPERMKELFDLVECLQTLGASKIQLKDGDIPYQVLSLFGKALLNKLMSELNNSREIQIPLFCGQKRAISKEEAICTINSIVTK